MNTSKTRERKVWRLSNDEYMQIFIIIYGLILHRIHTTEKIKSEQVKRKESKGSKVTVVSGG